jgi:hypothetical protein
MADPRQTRCRPSRCNRRPVPLDVAAFEIALNNALKDGVAGYVAQLRQSGQILFTNKLEYAKRRPQDGDELWKSNVQMHVASVSKLMTAMAMTVLLRDHNISPDAKIIDYLPDYWAKGPNIEYIVFRNLFNHTSGLSADYRVDFDKMKSAIAGGINLPIAGGTNPNTLTLGQYKYQNLNYGLFRILLAVINGYINKNMYWGLPPISDPVNDQIWDTVTIAAYEVYLQVKVFQPSNVVGATLDHPPPSGAGSYQIRAYPQHDDGQDARPQRVSAISATPGQDHRLKTAKALGLAIPESTA